MINNQAISENYFHGDLLHAIQASILKLGKSTDDVTIEDLAPVDEFHIGGRLATENLLSQLSFSDQSKILDVGCGLGGAARFASSKYNSQVTGIDLSEEYIETGKSLCAWVKLDKKVTLQQGSAVAMPFQTESFDGAYMLHVGMNIEDKKLLFKEIFRVLRPGSWFGIYDIMRISKGDLVYPVPWATKTSISILATPDEYKQALSNAGLRVLKEKNRQEFALEFFKKLHEKNKASGGPPPLGLHTLMKESTTIKIQNMVDNIASNYIAPVEMITHKA
jgi:ubiquinone/menaquinone biosynthesis C-methylase UbiE